VAGSHCPTLHAAPRLGAAAHPRLRLPALRLLRQLTSDAAQRTALRVVLREQPRPRALIQREDLFRLKRAALPELQLRERQGPVLTARLTQQDAPLRHRGGPEPLLYVAPPLAALGGGGVLRARQTGLEACSDARAPGTAPGADALRAWSASRWLPRPAALPCRHAGRHSVDLCAPVKHSQDTAGSTGKGWMHRGMSPMCPLPAGKGCKRGQRCRMCPGTRARAQSWHVSQRTQQRAAGHSLIEHESGGSQHPGRRKWHDVLHWPKQPTLL